jgi:protein-S-isoprenylcysteine O-methyltransferase Ste14
MSNKRKGIGVFVLALVLLFVLGFFITSLFKFSSIIYSLLILLFVFLITSLLILFYDNSQLFYIFI